MLLLALSFCKFGRRARDSGREVSSFLDRSMEVRFSQDLGTEKCVISVVEKELQITSVIHTSLTLKLCPCVCNHNHVITADMVVCL